MKNPHNPYIQVCDIPKIAELERQFPGRFTIHAEPGLRRPYRQHIPYGDDNKKSGGNRLAKEDLRRNQG